MATLTINTPKPPSLAHRRLARRDLRVSIAAAVWLVMAAAIPVSAIVIGAGQDAPAASASAPHVAPYIEAKVGGPATR